MDDVNQDNASQMSDSAGMDQTINTILSPSDSSDQGNRTVDLNRQPQGNTGAPTQFNFAGRQWKAQQEAEKAYNRQYGELSESKGVINMIKKALDDPQLLQAMSADAKWAPILAKLGIQADEEVQAQEQRRQPSGQMTHEMVMHELQTERARTGLEREEWAFERKLGKALNDDEHNAVMSLIQKAPSLKFEEAYFLCNKDKMMADAARKAAQNAAPPKSNRSQIIPRGIPGQQYDLKKPVEQMGPDEYREYLRSQPEFQALLSRE